MLGAAEPPQLERAPNECNDLSVCREHGVILAERPVSSKMSDTFENG